MLELRGLSKSYGGRRVVDNVSLTVRGGEIVGLLGKNGAGKTTTFRIVMGIVRPESGEVKFNRQDVTRLPMYERAKLGLGYLPQEHSVFVGLSVRANILAVLEVRGVVKDERLKRTEELLKEFGIEHLARKRASTLSGGEKRRLEIARALAIEPKILLLDEPFTGVDPIAIAEIKEMVVGLTRRGIGVLVTDHNVRDTLTITDRAYILESGRVLASGSPKELVESVDVRRMYLGESFAASFSEEIERWRERRYGRETKRADGAEG